MEKELLFSVTANDCKWQYFCSGGKGGQHQNKTASACRVTHEPSGAVGESRELKQQWQNRKLAFSRMAESKKMQVWLKMEAARRMVSSEEKRRREDALNHAVEVAMHPRNIKFEIIENGAWKEVSEDQINATPIKCETS